MRIWLLLLLLVPLAAPNAGALEPALAPVQVASEESGRAILRAIDEATYDGTAGDAQVLMDLLLEYAHGFSTLRRVPTSDTLTHEAIRALYGGLEELVLDLRPIPGDLSIIETVGANCVADADDVVAKVAIGWIEDYHSARGRLFAAVALAEQIIASHSAFESPQLQLAIMALQQWQETRAVDIAGCLAQIEERLELDSPFIITVEVLPIKPYPGGRLQFIGWTNAGADVKVDGAVSALIKTDGSFNFTWNIPPRWIPGTSFWTFSAGSAATTVPAVVGRAPTYLEFVGPQQVLLGQRADFEAQLISPLAATSAPTHILAPDFNETVDLAAPRIIRFEPTSGGQFSVQADFPGGLRHKASSLYFELIVIDPAELASKKASPGFFGAAPGAEQIEELLAKLRESTAKFVEFAQQPIGWLFFALIAAIAAFFLWKSRMNWGSTRMKRVVPHIGLGVVGAVGGLIAWLTATGIAPPSSTAREIRAQLDADGMPDDGLIHAFEQERYGRRDSGLKKTAATQWAWKIIGNLRRKP